MEIRHIFDEKHTFLPLLLLGDEQEDMIARYLGRSDLFACTTAVFSAQSAP